MPGTLRCRPVERGGRWRGRGCGRPGSEAHRLLPAPAANRGTHGLGSRPLAGSWVSSALLAHPAALLAGSGASFLPAGVGCGAHRTAGQCCRRAAAVHRDPSLQPGHPGVPIPPVAPRPLLGRRVPCLMPGGGASPWAPGVSADGEAAAYPAAAAVAQRGQSHRRLETSLPPFSPPTTWEEAVRTLAVVGASCSGERTPVSAASARGR